MKKLFNYSLLMFLFSFIAFACSKEDGEVNPTASLRNTSTSDLIIGGFDFDCITDEGDGVWSFPIDGTTARHGLSNLQLELLDCDGLNIPLGVGEDLTEVERAYIVINEKEHDLSISYIDGSCAKPTGQFSTFVKLEFNEGLDEFIKGKSGTLYLVLKDGDDIILSGARIIVKTGGKDNKCYYNSIITCYDYCEDEPNGGDDCTKTQGYWKTHGPVGCNPSGKANNYLWPSTIKTNGLVLGGQSYTAAQLCGILNTSVRGTNLGLTHQLIAALINIANGADGTLVQDCIVDAQAHLAASGGINGTPSSTSNNLTECLADFNESSGNNCVSN